MTPTELHAWVRARWQKKLDTARAATPGPWLADPTGTVCAAADLVDDMLPEAGPMEIAECYRYTRAEERGENAQHIAAFDPSFAIAVCEAALARLDRHMPLTYSGPHFCEYCASLCHSTSGMWCDSPDAPWPCVEFLSDAVPFRTHPDFPEELRTP
jgi:hypothetical protein